MNNLLAFLSKHSHWLIFLFLEVVSVLLLVRFNRYHAGVWFTSANAIAGQLNSWRAQMDAYFHLEDVNTQLTQRNLVLEQQLRRTREQLREARKQQPDTVRGLPLSTEHIRLIRAKVVDNSVNRPDNLITIDKGRADGVQTDMGVACGTGVVGIVYLTSQHYSVVVPVLNMRSNISCSIAGRGYFGYLHWNGGASDVAYVDDIPRHATFKKGDEIVTSGYSAVFPPGILVGKVTNIENSADGLSYRLQVKLSTNFANLRDVCVINDRSARERLQLLRSAQDSIKLQKLQ